MPIPAASQVLRPELLPGSRAIIGTVAQGETRSAVPVDRASGEVTVLLVNATHPHYIPTGHLIFGRSTGGVFAAPFDLRGGVVTGPAVPVVEGVSVFGGGATQFAVSSNGTAVYLSGSSDLADVVVEVAENQVERAVTPPGVYRRPRCSPAGDAVALLKDMGRNTNRVEFNGFVLDLARGTLSRRTFEGNTGQVIWSPDGKALAFSLGRRGAQVGQQGDRPGTPRSGAPDTLGGASREGMYRIPADGSGAATLLLTASGLDPGDCSPDNHTILLSDQRDVKAMTLAGDSSVVRPYGRELGRLRLRRGRHGRSLRPRLPDPIGQGPGLKGRRRRTALVTGRQDPVLSATGRPVPGRCRAGART